MLTEQLFTATAEDVIETFHAKAEKIATANGWTVDHAQEVMLRYLHATDPETAAAITAAFLGA